jgi:Lrp/AsnC family transcriptional regulator for asnA, asnC and gidA
MAAGDTRSARRATRSAAEPHLLRLAVDMSEIDGAIIRLLQVDGRAPFARIARQVGVAEKTVRRRVRELREGGVIDITTVTDPQLLGYGAMALAGIRLDGSKRTSDVAAELAAIEAVDYVVVTTGRFEALVELVCHDPADLLRTVETEIWPVRAVRDVELLPYLRLHYQEPRWDAARQVTRRRSLAAGGLRLDELDRAVLAELNADGRTPFQHIARSFGVSESKVRQRVARMVESGAVRILAITNPRSLGFHRLGWLGIGVAPGARVQELADRLSSLSSIAYLAICAGRYDILAEVVCVDDADLLRVIDDEVRQQPGVASVEAFVILDLLYKRVRAPGRSDEFLPLDQPNGAV